MSKVNINLFIPETLDDITLGQYQEFSKIEKPTEEDLFEIFCNVPKDYIKFIPLEDAKKCIDNLINIFNDMDKPRPHIQIWERDGQSYGFIPNLDQMSYGEYLDLGKYMTGWETMDRAMSILYRKITKRFKNKYQIEQYTANEYDEYNMKDVSLSIAVSAQVFFYALTRDLLQAIPSYISRIAEDNKGQISKEHLQQIGEHMDNYLHLHREMFAVSTKLQNLTFTNV